MNELKVDFLYICPRKKPESWLIWSSEELHDRVIVH